MFKKYLIEVDNEIRRLSGNIVGMSDLSDYLYRDAYEDEVSAEEVAREVLIENGFPVEDE
jgi:hypothetical protein